MKMQLTTISAIALFAGAAMAADPTSKVWSIENQDSFTVNADEYVQAEGYYHTVGGQHRGPVYNVGTMTINGIFESYVQASGRAMLGAQKVLGNGELRVRSALFVAPETDFSGFTGKVSGQYGCLWFTNSNSASYSINVSEFDLSEKMSLRFTNGGYTVNGAIKGAGSVLAATYPDTQIEDGVYLFKNAEAANVTLKGDISQFTGSFHAEDNSRIILATKLNNSFSFIGATGGTLELVGAEGDAKKTITIDSHSDTTTNGNVFMYGNNAIIADNSRADGKVDGANGTIYFGGNHAYTQSEKLVYTFDKTTVTGNNAGHVTVGGRGAGSVMENGSDITVDGVNVGYLTAGAAEGGVVNGDINVLVKSGDISAIYGGLGGVHNGNTVMTVEGGKIGAIAIGDYYGGKVDGNMTLNITGGEIDQVYGVNYLSTSEGASDFNGVNGNVQINVSGGTVKNIRGGINTTNSGDSATAQKKMVLNGNVEINVRGNANIASSDGESILAVGGSYGSVNGNTIVNISDNATVEGIIAMGGSRNNAAVKSTFLNISGGTLGGDIYAGALKAATVLGDTNVTISGGTINGDIYGGGGKADTTVNGNSNITLTGSSTNINGTIYGGAKDGGVVNGDKILNIGTIQNSFAGNSALNIADFDILNVGKASKVQFANSISLDVLQVATDAEVSLASGTDFAKLVLAFDGDFTQGESGDFNLETVFGSSTSVVLSALENSAITFKDANGVEWSLEKSEITDGTISYVVGSQIPEPATCAAIFGAFALAFAAYRRRR